MMERFFAVGGSFAEVETLVVCREAEICVPEVEGVRKIFVKAVDVFGYESRALVCEDGC